MDEVGLLGPFCDGLYVLKTLEGEPYKLLTDLVGPLLLIDSCVKFLLSKYL